MFVSHPCYELSIRILNQIDIFQLAWKLGEPRVSFVLVVRDLGAAQVLCGAREDGCDGGRSSVLYLYSGFHITTGGSYACGRNRGPFQVVGVYACEALNRFLA